MLDASSQDAADRIPDVSRIEACRRHLVEQGLERVVVALINDRYFDRPARKSFGRCQSTEPGSDDYDPVHGCLPIPSIADMAPPAAADARPVRTKSTAV